MDLDALATGGTLTGMVVVVTIALVDLCGASGGRGGGALVLVCTGVGSARGAAPPAAAFLGRLPSACSSLSLPARALRFPGATSLPLPLSLLRAVTRGGLGATLGAGPDSGAAGGSAGSGSRGAGGGTGWRGSGGKGNAFGMG